MNFLLEGVRGLRFYSKRRSIFSHLKRKLHNNIKTMMNIVPLEALNDNYMYLLVDEESKECAAVDPVEPEKLLQHVQRMNLKLTHVLTTHHHWDHANGNPKLLSLLDKKIPVYGGDDRIPALSNKVTHNDTIRIGTQLKATCLFTPCHTTGHICYFVTAANENSSQIPVVFTGDTLFLAGCGRFFEGNAEQMHNNLMNILAKLPPQTLVYCGHEYSVSNLKYALHVEPDNEHAKKKLDWSMKQRAQSKPTIPSSIQEELLYNPFMRCNMESLMQRYKQFNSIDCMREMRREKDAWKPT